MYDFDAIRRGAGEADSAVENRTNGEESEKACTVDVHARNVAARESCMMA